MDLLLSIENVAGENGALVIFTCNNCPFVVGRGKKTEGWEGRYNGIISFAESLGIGTLLLIQTLLKETERTMSAL